MLVHRDLFFIIIAILITFVVYSDSFNNAFIWDDYCFVVENKAIRSLTPTHMLSYFSDYRTSSSSESLSRDVYRPLVTTSYALDYRLWDLNSNLYHVENTLLHTVNVFLVYLVVKSIVDSSAAALLAALVFGIHPVQTEAVTWISGRSNMLFLLFFLAALLAHISNARKATRPTMALPLVLFTLGLFAKEMTVTLPAVMLLYDAHFAPKKSVREYIEYYLPFFLVAVSYLAARRLVVGTLAQGEYWGSNFFENLLTSCKAVAGYVRLLFFPVNLRADYTIEVSRSIAEPDTAIAVGALGAIAVLYGVFMRRRTVSFFILWFFVTLAPVSNIVPFRAILAERLLYLPLIGFAALLAVAATKTPKRARTLAAVAISALVVFYGAATAARNKDWRSEITLYTKDLPKTPRSPRFHYNLALAYSREYLAGASKEKLKESRPYYELVKKELEETIRLRPDHRDAYLNLGNIYNELGEYDKAITCFMHVLKMEENPDAYNNLGVVAYDRGRYDEAISYYKKALLLPWERSELGYSNLGNAYFMKKDYVRAKEAWKRVLMRDPENREIGENVKKLGKLGF